MGTRTRITAQISAPKLSLDALTESVFPAFTIATVPMIVWTAAMNLRPARTKSARRVTSSVVPVEAALSRMDYATGYRTAVMLATRIRHTVFYFLRKLPIGTAASFPSFNAATGHVLICRLSAMATMIAEISRMK